MDTQRLVREAMTTPVVAVLPDVALDEIAHVLTTRRIGAVPVVERSRRVIGVVTEADVLRGASAGQETAADVMSTPVVTVRGDTAMGRCHQLMVRHGVGRLPVVDGYGRLVGIITRHDLLVCVLPADSAVRRRVMEQVVGAGGAVSALTVVHGAVWMRVRVASPAAVPVIERVVREVIGVTGLDLEVSLASEDGEAAAAVDVAVDVPAD